MPVCSTRLFRWLIALAGAAAQAQGQCACPDGRTFSVGAAMFGQNSARVMVTGFAPDHASTDFAASAAVPRCSGIQVVGQAVDMQRSLDGRPFLKRETRKRGVIRDICRTHIRFVRAAKSYNFFADDGSAVTLDANTPAASAPTARAAEDSSEDLTGKDLLRFDSQARPRNPRNSAFDEDDLKETAYVIVRKRVKAPAYTDYGAMSGEVEVSAGTLGRIEKRAGSRSEPMWNVELFPDSAPAPFWRSLAVSIGRKRAASNRVVLASSQVVEINHFLDRYRVEMTRFGNALARTDQNPGTTDLPQIFARPVLPLAENIAEAQAAGAVDSIEKALATMVLFPKNVLPKNVLSKNALPSASGVVILEESGESREADLLRRQCFVEADGNGGPLVVSGAGVKIFRPPASEQVSPDYYAVDLDLWLRSTAGSARARAVCRFPFEPIGIALVDRARRILSTRFDVKPSEVKR